MSRRVKLVSLEGQPVGEFELVDSPLPLLTRWQGRFFALSKKSLNPGATPRYVELPLRDLTERDLVGEQDRPSVEESMREMPDVTSWPP